MPASLRTLDLIEATPDARASACESQAKRTMGKSGSTAQGPRRAGFGVGEAAHAEAHAGSGSAENSPPNSRESANHSARRATTSRSVGARVERALIGAGNLSNAGAHMLALMSFLGDALLAAFSTEYESIREVADRP